MNNRWFVGCVIVAPLVALAQSAPATSAQAGPSSFHYVDETSRLPPDTNPPDTDTLDVDFVDGDGDLDLFVAEGTASAAPRSNKLYLNDGGGNFTDESALRLPATPPANSTEVEFADVDNDGDPDILVSNENPFDPSPLGGAPERLWINDGAGRFADESAARLPARTDQTQGIVPGDIDGDGDLDLIVVNSRNQQERLYFNDGCGAFTDVTTRSLPARLDTGYFDARHDRQPNRLLPEEKPHERSTRAASSSASGEGGGGARPSLAVRPARRRLQHRHRD